MTIPTLRGIADDSFSLEHAANHDALVVVAPTPFGPQSSARVQSVSTAIERALATDASLTRGARAPVVIPAAAAPGGRLVLAPMKPLTDDVDDVRSVAEATAAAIARAVEAGSTKPLLVVVAPTDVPRFSHATEVAALAALGSQWSPLEAREAGKSGRSAESIAVLGLGEARAKELAAIELGRAFARDIAGTEPERMTPKRAAGYCQEAFAGAPVKLAIEEDVRNYPLLAAVARASNGVERHRPCVITLDYAPADAKRTLILVGKGVTYDTGGADLKTDGHMAGMSRDKGGAAAVAGFVRAVAALAMPGVRVLGLLGMVRNSVGEDGYVSDEIIKSRAGVRVRIGNTDAEGRLVLADLLARAKEIAADVPSPFIATVATLTGHVHRAYGPYVGAIGNAVARAEIDRLELHAEQWGEPIERSRPRREDYAFVAARSAAEDVVSSNRLASVNTPRGHQFPFAFLDIASGLRGTNLPFAHLDIGGAAYDPADWQFGRPTATPILSLCAWAQQR